MTPRFITGAHRMVPSITPPPRETERCLLCGRDVPAGMVTEGACEVWCRIVQPGDPMPQNKKVQP